jgi:hypothetical protein
VGNPQPLPKKYDFSLYRGDTRVWEHHFFDAPPEWAASTDYVTGVVGSSTYLADSTVTYAGVTYTCVAAHTSGESFDASKWVKDAAAVGAPIDMTDWAFLSQYRETTEDAVVLAEDECAVTDGPGGVMRRTLTHDQAMNLPASIAAGETSARVAWDLQATKPDGQVKTYLFNDAVKVGGDVSRSDES